MEFEGMNGLQVLWHLLMTDMFIQGIVLLGVFIALLCVYFDKDDETSKYIKDDTSHTL